MPKSTKKSSKQPCRAAAPNLAHAPGRLVPHRPRQTPVSKIEAQTLVLQGNPTSLKHTNGKSNAVNNDLKDRVQPEGCEKTIGLVRSNFINLYFRLSDQYFARPVGNSTMHTIARVFLVM